jgi:hypothetical protein
MLEKSAFAEKAFAQRQSRIVLPPIPLTISTMIETPEPEIFVIGEGNFDSQQIVTSQASARAWPSEVGPAEDVEKLVDGPEVKDT